MNLRYFFSPYAAFLCIVSVFFALSLNVVWAVNPDEMLADPAQEMRARGLGKQIRCVVCQNESIDESNADLARDLRRVVREKITAGASDQDVLNFLVDRYGAYILLNPPFNIRTLALWLGPLFLCAIGLGLVFMAIRRRHHTKNDPVPLSPEEEATLRRLLNKEPTP